MTKFVSTDMWRALHIIYFIGIKIIHVIQCLSFITMINDLGENILEKHKNKLDTLGHNNITP